MSRRRAFEPLTVVLAAAASSELPALAATVRAHLGSEPVLRAAVLAAALLAGAFAARREAHKAWLFVGAPAALVFFGPLLDGLSSLAAWGAGSAVSSPLAVPLRVVAGVLAGAIVGGLLGLGAGALAGSKRLQLAFASGAAMIALVPDGPRALGAGLGLVALAAWRREPPRRQEARDEAKNRAWGQLLASIGLAGVIGLVPVAARVAAVEGTAPELLALMSVLGLALGARIHRAPILAVAAPSLALTVVWVPGPLLVVPLLLAATASGLALARPNPLALTLAALLGAGLEQALLRGCERIWPEDKKMALAGARGDLLQAFSFTSHGAVAVVDSRQGNTRELRRDGTLLGSVAIGKGPSAADVRTPVLASVLSQLLGRPGGRIACLGFGDGIAAARLGETSGLTDIFLVEPDPGIRALRDDPGDLFHGAWKESFATVVPEDARSFLRRASPFDAILDLEGALADSSALATARKRLTERAALVRVLRDGASFKSEAHDFSFAFKTNALVFRAGSAAIAVGGVAAIDPRRALAPRLSQAVATAQLPEPDLLGTFVCGPEGLREADSVAALAPRGGDLARLASLLGGNDELLTVADSAIRVGNLPVARRILEGARALGARPDAEIDRALGDVAFREGREKEAVALWHQALGKDPKALSPKLSLALLHITHGQRDKAKTLLEEALVGERQKDAPAHYLLGKLAFYDKDYSKAHMHFDLARGFEDAGEWLQKTARIQEAIEAESSKSTPVLPPEQKDPKRLLEEARLILSHAADLETSFRAKGLTLSHEDLEMLYVRRQEAESLLVVAVRKEPGNPVLHFELAHARRALHDYKGAAEELEATARLDPNDRRALYALGDLLRDAGQREAALDAYERGLARGPLSSGSAPVFLACADLLVSLGRLEDAARKLEEAERAGVAHPNILANLGAIYERLGRKGDALLAYRRCLELVQGGDSELEARVRAAVSRLEASR